MALYDDFRAAFTRAAEPVRAAVDTVVALADRRRRGGTAAAPDTFEQRVAPEPAIDRWPTVLGSQVTFQYIASVLRLCQNGYRQQFVDLLDEALERDPHLYAVLQQRILAVAGGHVELVPPPGLTKGSPEAERAAEICAEIKRRIAAIPNLVQTLARLLWGLYYGMTGAEIVWDLRADGWHVQSLGFIHSRRLAYPDQNAWDLHIWDQGPVQPLTGFGAFPTERFFGLRVRDYPGKFLIFSPSLRGDYPTREGLGRQVIFYTAMKNMAMRGAGQYVERFAKPFALAYYNTKTAQNQGYPRVADQPDMDAANAALKALGVGGLSAAVLPDSVEVKLDGPAIKGSGSGMTQADLVNLCNAEVSKAVRGGTLTTDTGENGNRNLGQVHAEGDARNARYDAVCLADALQPLADWLTRLNYPGELHLTPVVRVEVEQKTPEQILDLATKAAESNIPVDADKIGEKLVLPLTDPENPKARRMAKLKPADLFALDTGTPANIPRALEALAELSGLHLTPGQISSLAELPRNETAQFVSDLLARVKQDAAASSMLSPSDAAPNAAAEGKPPPPPKTTKGKGPVPPDAGAPEAPEATDDADAQEPVGGDAEGAAKVDLRATGPAFIPWDVDDAFGGEAPPDAPMGRWAWPQYRGLPAEPPTDAEERLYRALQRHFQTKHTGLPAEDAALLMQMVAAGFYKSVLHAPPQETLYRGLLFNSRAAAAAFLGLDESAMEEEGDIALGRAMALDDGHSTSWTAQKKISRDFSQPEHRARGWAVTLIADVEANETRFLAGPGGLYDVQGLSRWHREKESVGLEPIVVRRAQWERLQTAPAAPPSPVAEPAEA